VNATPPDALPPAARSVSTSGTSPLTPPPDESAGVEVAVLKLRARRDIAAGGATTAAAVGGGGVGGAGGAGRARAGALVGAYASLQM